jgi:hypothetical protein
MDTAEASPRYELAGRMESILRTHCVEFLLDGYALLVRVGNKKALDRRRSGIDIRVISKASIEEFCGLCVSFAYLVPSE